MQLDTSMHEMESDESLLYSMDQNALTLRTMMLAECVSFDAGQNCVTVQPLLQTNIDGNVSNIPPIKDVPVGFYQAGGFVITHNPSPGDVCMLLISDRNISKWKLTGGIVDPKSSQHHNMNDAVAYFGLNAFPDAVSGVQDGIDVRSLDGSVSLHVNASSITAKVGDSTHTLSASNYSLSVGGANTMTATSSGVNFGVPVTMPNGATINGIPFNTHKHTGVESGGGTSGGSNFMRSDFELDSNSWDLVITDDIGIVENASMTSQDSKFSLQLIQGEVFDDNRIGMPWLTDMVSPQVSIAAKKQIIRDVIMSTPGAIELTRVEVAVDTDSAIATCEFEGITDNGEIFGSSIGA